MKKYCEVFCLGTSGLSLTFSLEHCNSQATGFSQIWQLQGFISLFQDLTRHHLFLSFTLQFPVSVSGFTETETSILFQKYFLMEVNSHSFAFQWSSFKTDSIIELQLCFVISFIHRSFRAKEAQAN